MAVANFLWSSRPRCLWWHSPNGDVRNKRAGARLKQMGVRRGVPDYIFIFPDNSIGFIELKLGKSRHHGKSYQSPDQKIFEAEYDDLVSGDGRYSVCRSVSEVREVLGEWGLLRDRQYG